MKMIRELRNTVLFRSATIMLRKRAYNQIVIHKPGFTRTLPPKNLISAFCKKNKGKISASPRLTILLVHNRPYRTILEQSLDYLGVKNYAVIRPTVVGEWRQTFKLLALLDYLERGECKTDFVLYCDSDDAIIRDDPDKAVDLLHEYNCEALFSNTSSAHYYSMSDAEIWARETARKENATDRRIHLNSGVYVARTEFLVKILRQAVKFVTKDDLPIRIVEQLREKDPQTLHKNFPYGKGCDQSIFRLLHPTFYPQMKVDYASRLALR